MTVRVSLCVLAFGLLAAGCAGGRDAARTPDEAPPRTPTTRTVDGFRIQILTTPEKAEADRQAAEALGWWEDLPARQRPAFGTQPPDVEVAWKPPYYRVRLGAFAERAEAREALALAKRRFPDAFLVPDRVTVTR